MYVTVCDDPFSPLSYASYRIKERAGCSMEVATTVRTSTATDKNMNGSSNSHSDDGQMFD